MARRTNSAGVALIKRFEGFSAVRYICPAGYPTIGYGHMIVDGEDFPEPLSIEEAERLLQQDLARFEAAVGRMVKVPITDNQFAALVSFAYNLGTGNLKASTLLRHLNGGQAREAAAQFKRWRFAGGRVLKGLVARRQAEAELFLK